MCKGCNSALNLRRVANVDRKHLDPERWCHRLDRAELAKPSGDSEISNNCRASHSGCDLLEKLEPFPAHTVFERHEAGGVAARPGQTIDQTSTNRIGYHHNQHGKCD